MKDITECHAGDAWGPAADDVAKNPPSPESETTHCTTVLHDHHHVVDLFDLSDYDEYSYSGMMYPCMTTAMY